jgi:type I restriction enzyme S subunit
MKRYDSYKDSGVKWIGEIPSHWKVKKIKYIFEERSEKGFPNEPVLCSTQKYGVIPQSMYENRVVVVNKGLDGLKLVRKGDFVISLRSFQGGIEYAHYQGIISAAYTILALNMGINADYMKYLLKSYDFIQLLQTCVTGIREGQNINYALLRKNYIALPSLAEQRAIVSFLDTELGEIDTYMDKEQQLIERLKELKQSLIARAVTHGINPNVKMKPSGINWIGEIPEHWEVKRLSQVAKEYFISNKDIHHQNLLSLSYGKIIRKDIKTTKGLLPSSFDNYQVVKNGVIVLRLTDLQNDHRSLRVGLAREEGIVTSAYLSIICRNNITSEYLYEQLHCNDIHKVFYGMGDGLRQSLNWDGLRNLLIALPPLSEQHAIVDYLQDKTSKIDKLISEKTRELEYMKELRQRIISDAVTGKIDVRS